MTVGIVVVSHSALLAAGVVELAGQMARGLVAIEAAGGTDDGALGASLAKTSQALERASSPEGTLVLVDLGSAALIAEMAIEQLPPERRALTRLTNAPIAEGAVLAAVESSIGSPLDAVAAAAEQATRMQKVVGRM
ncbi:MAG TPA: dihydroxyacetone kinase phosphoryl donor subunit DhaM [Ktedonobacterales bacterium]